MVIPDSNLHVVCDFIGGYAFGKALGVGVRALGGEWEILAVEMNKPSVCILFGGRRTGLTYRFTTAEIVTV